MRRGDVVTVATKGHYSGKPRPALVVQSDHFAALDSVTICLITTEQVDSPLLRISVQPSTDNGLERACQVQVDKLVSVPRARLGRQIGTLETDVMTQVDRALALFLGFG